VSRNQINLNTGRILYADAGRLRFRDRPRIERCLFRIAAKASRKVGYQLRGLDEASGTVRRYKSAEFRQSLGWSCEPPALKAELAAVAQSMRIHREYDGILERRVSGSSEIGAES
jgi:hypothetical protein